MMKLLQYTKSILTTKMVLIVRNDLKMGKGKIASQCAHAAILCKTGFYFKFNKKSIRLFSFSIILRLSEKFTTKFQFT